MTFDVINENGYVGPILLPSIMSAQLVRKFFSSQWTFSTSIVFFQSMEFSISIVFFLVNGHFPHPFRIPRRLTYAALAVIGGRIFHIHFGFHSDLRVQPQQLLVDAFSTDLGMQPQPTLAIIGGRIFLISFVESLRWRMLLLPHSLTERAKQLSNFSIFLISNVIYIYIIFFKCNN